MAMIETWFSQDLNEPVQVQQLDGNVFSQDNQGNLVGVNVFDGGEPATLSGSVSASVIRSDGSTVAVTGVLSGNSCYIILPAAAYAVPGIISIVIKLTGGGSTTTLCAVVANVYQSATDATVDPGTIIPSVQALIAEIENAVASIPADYSDFYNAYKRNVNQGFLMADIAFPPYDNTLPKTQNGITFSKTGDGGISVSGVATGTATFIIRENFAIPSNVDKVNLFGCPSGGSDTTYRLGLAKYTGPGTYENLVADEGNGVEYYIEDRTATYTLVIRIGSGTVMNGVFYPAITDAESLSNKAISENVLFGENLVTLPYYDGSFSGRSGVDAVSPWDGSVVLSSQGTNDTNINFYVKTDISFSKDIQRVKIGGCPPNGAQNKYCIRLGKYTQSGSGTSGWSTIATDYGEGAEAEILPDGRYILVITALPSQAFSNVKFTPYLANANSVSVGTIQSSVYGNTSIVFLKTSGDYQGDCVIVRTGAINGVFDLGYDENVTTLKSALANNGIKKLDFIVITHYHSDHVGGTFSTAIDNLIAAGIDLSECVFYLPHKGIDWALWVGTGDNKQIAESEAIQKIQSMGVPYVFPDNNQVFSYNKDFSMRFFNTEDFSGYYNYTYDMNEIPTDHTNYNSFSMLTEITAYGKKVLMMADATPITQEKCYQYINGCDLYKIEHHGLNSGAYDAFLNCIAPQYAVIQSYSRNYTNIYTYTRKTVRALAQKCAIYSTIDGAVTATINSGGISVSGGQATKVGYDNIPFLTMQSIAGLFVSAIMHPEEAVSISSNKPSYMGINGKYFIKNNIVYFFMCIDVLSNINTGLSEITTDLPTPKDQNAIFLDVSGAIYSGSITYDSGWRINGKHEAGSYTFVSGVYEMQQQGG